MLLNSILENLDLLDKDGLFYQSDIESIKSDIFTTRVRESLRKIKPDAFFCINNEPLILFFNNTNNLELLYKQIWNFNQSPAIFINKNNQWIIKNGFKFIKDKNELETLSNNISDFDYFKIISGKTWEDYKLNFENNNRVDYYLLRNIESARQILIKELNPKVANSLIGRIIFIRYLIDRNVKLNKYNILDRNEFYNILEDKNTAYSFFNQLTYDFNGNLFPLEYKINGTTIQEKDLVSNGHLKILISLLRGDSLSSDTTQMSMFDIYDFSIIPIEFVSNVYEKFIGIDNQAKQGAYYTPLFLVDYVQKETVSKYFFENPNQYNCKVLDPACGSGIFLVETLRQIIAKYKVLNPDYNFNNESYKENLKTLLTENIYGIDKDENAISVAIFSLYITLLDYLEPSSIVGFQFPMLLNTNFFINDFFDLNAEYNKKFSQFHFQFILGNPPWATKHPKEKQLFEKYIENRKKEENSNLEIENREIAEAFLTRVSDFNFNECGLIIVSKILYKISRKHNKKGIFRNYFLTNYKIRQVFELSSVRHQVFGGNSKKKNEDKAVAPATILFFSKSSNIAENRNNLVIHISLKPNIFFETFRLMVIEKFDFKELLQSYFMDADWVWKVFVYGNILDYYFIKRLKKHNSIYDYISDKKQFIFGKGISIGGGDKNPIEEHKRIKFSINSMGKGLKPFHIEYSDNLLAEREHVHRPRKIELFKAPILLVGKGISNDFKAKSAISNIDVIYTDAITGIKPLSGNKNIINTLLALFNSELFSYFLVLTNSSIGIEREQSHDKDDKFSVPLICERRNDNLNLIIDDLTNLINLYNLNLFEDDSKHYLRKEISSLKRKLNSELFDIYQLSNIEKHLIDYNNTITIPLLKGKEIEKKRVVSKIKYEDLILHEYAQIFINHFGQRFDTNGKKFEVEIVYSNYSILMKFKVNPNPSKEKNNISWTKLGDKELIKFLAKISYQNLSQNLFIQKDIKGFEKDYFYIAKPNQFKLWHPALAHLDLSEFMDALHNSNSQKNE